jgi:hypothetical protein
MSETNENLPFNLTNLEHQVAGHYIGSKSKLGLIFFIVLSLSIMKKFFNTILF